MTAAFTGLIAAAAFRGTYRRPAPDPDRRQPAPAGSEVVVVGAWRHSPLGRFVDVMWVRGDGHRVLLAPSEAVARFVSSVYVFDRVQVVALRGGWDGTAVTVEAGPLRLRLQAGPRDWRSWLFALRPRVLRRWPPWLALEERVARPLVAL
ncbi:MAG TPA: hypothetical protein VG452_08690, partial [Egibacteraceae bacterium]|nr:hypothetical protein [Egibacteraceae bacterium]